MTISYIKTKVFTNILSHNYKILFASKGWRTYFILFYLKVYKHFSVVKNLAYYSWNFIYIPTSELAIIGLIIKILTQTKIRRYRGLFEDAINLSIKMTIMDCTLLTKIGCIHWYKNWKFYEEWDITIPK
jgi:hypothetical protein